MVPSFIPGFASLAEGGRNGFRECLQAGSHLGEAAGQLPPKKRRRQRPGGNHLSSRHCWIQKRTSVLSFPSLDLKVIVQSLNATLCSVRCR